MIRIGIFDLEPYFKTRLGRLYCGDALGVLKKLPSECVDVVITSPPYWAKRDYGEATCKVWGGDPNCDHEWTDEIIVRQRGVAGVGNTGNQSKIIPGQDTHQVRGKFCKKCGAWYGQLGLEPTPHMFVDHLVEIFREVKRVLKPTGSLFVVIDDTWSGSGFSPRGNDNLYSGRQGHIWSGLFQNEAPRKSLTLVPELFAIKMVYEEGWILREKIIWAKKVHFYKKRTTYGNAMPESVKDRFCHTWEYIYHFTKKPKYYFDLDPVRVPLKTEIMSRTQRGIESQKLNGTTKGIMVEKLKKYYNEILQSNGVCPLGANPGDVIQTNVKPFKDAHFAVFPLEIPEMLIKVACPRYVCPKCGKPFKVIKEYTETTERIDFKYYGATESGEYHGKPLKDYKKTMAEDPSEVKKRILQSMKKAIKSVRYEPDCRCGLEGVSGVVLDPFAGAGTTLIVAEKLGMRWIGIEINPEYCEIIKKRFEKELGGLIYSNRLF